MSCLRGWFCLTLFHYIHFSFHVNGGGFLTVQNLHLLVCEVGRRLTGWRVYSGQCRAGLPALCLPTPVLPPCASPGVSFILLTAFGHDEKGTLG